VRVPGITPDSTVTLDLPRLVTDAEEFVVLVGKAKVANPAEVLFRRRFGSTIRQEIATTGRETEDRYSDGEPSSCLDHTADLPEEKIAHGRSRLPKQSSPFVGIKMCFGHMGTRFFVLPILGAKEAFRWS
jgi:hypothetical protein